MMKAITFSWRLALIGLLTATFSFDVSAQEGDLIGDIAVVEKTSLKCGKRKKITKDLGRGCVNATSVAEAIQKYQDERIVSIASLTYFCDPKDCDLPTDKCEMEFDGWWDDAFTPTPTPNGDSTVWCFPATNKDYWIRCTDCLSPRLAPGQPQAEADQAVVEELTGNSVDRGEAHIQVYPNPASDQIQVELELTTEVTTASYIIADQNGKAVQHESLADLSEGVQTRWIDVTQLVPGTYFLSIVNQDKVIGTQVLVVGR